jgi:hypothetical protein
LLNISIDKNTSELVKTWREVIGSGPQRFMFTESRIGIFGGAHRMCIHNNMEAVTPPEYLAAEVSATPRLVENLTSAGGVSIKGNFVKSEVVAIVFYKWSRKKGSKSLNNRWKCRTNSGKGCRLKCVNCGKRGHHVMDCEKPKQSGLKKCFSCNKAVQKFRNCLWLEKEKWAVKLRSHSLALAEGCATVDQTGGVSVKLLLWVQASNVSILYNNHDISYFAQYGYNFPTHINAPLPFVALERL